MEMLLPPGVGTDTSSRFYVAGQWVEPFEPASLDVVDPATEQRICSIAAARGADVDRAAEAAKAAFDAYSRTTVPERLDLLRRIMVAYQARLGDFAAAISAEMGAPRALAEGMQAPIGLGHLAQMMAVLEGFAFETTAGTTRVRREPVGVCGLITPWNWPVHQVLCKVLPALAAGCTVVLKPSEFAPLSAGLLAQVLHEAGTPPGVFNLVHGDAVTGQLIAAHPLLDMVSFTGSTRAGIDVAQRAAPTVKRVHQELGGKSAFIVLPDADLAAAVDCCVRSCFLNSGQNCNAPTRLLVRASDEQRAIDLARDAAQATVVGLPGDPHTQVGPLVNGRQFQHVQRLIQAGIDEGAQLVCGGPGRPDPLTSSYFCRPTVFARVHPSMRIAREEIFGPVLCIMTYENEEDAVRLANDTPTGLAAYVYSADLARAEEVAAQLRVGNVHLNEAMPDLAAPFGGYKQSGNGREFGEYGLDAFLEHKAVLGAVAAEMPRPQSQAGNEKEAPLPALRRTVAPRMAAPSQLCNLDRLVARMKQQGLDAMVAMYATNQYYMSSYARHSTIPEEIGMHPVVISRHAPHNPVLVMPDIDLARLDVQPTWIRDIRPYATVLPYDVPAHPRELRRFVPARLLDDLEGRLGSNPVYHLGLGDAVVAALKDLGMAGGRVGFDNLGFGMALRQALPALKPQPAENDFRYVRQQKTVAEIALLRQSTLINQTAQVRAMRQWTPGMTFRELVFAFQVEALALGGSPNLPDSMQMVNDPGCARVAHSDREVTDHVLIPGEHVMFDCHGKYNGYCWDGGKTWVVGSEPTSAARRDWAGVTACLEEINQRARPGARLSELAAAGRRAMLRAGGNDDGALVYFHGVGLDHIDMDMAASGRDWTLERDSVLSTHIYLPGGTTDRCFMEDIALIREGGVERFFTWDESLH
ncbi:MAG: aldehyde dehydrogenase family protein [Ramlibacter sp.]|nr:aldehyde dehydrogenase family protein [Ramlibacter sp.]